MNDTPTQAELILFVEDQLSAARSRAIARAAAADPALAEEIDAIRTDLRFADELRTVGGPDVDPDAERRIFQTLSESVTSNAQSKSHEDQKDRS